MKRSISPPAISLVKLLMVLCSAVASTGLCAPTMTYVWTNQFPGHLAGTGDMNQSTNWSPNGVPTPMNGPDFNGVCGDLLVFDGRTTGPLSVTESGGTLAGFGGQPYPAGARILLTSNQTSSVTLMSPGGTSGGIRMNWFTIDAGAGGLNIGRDSTVDVFDIIGGEINGQVFGFTNNSVTPSVINPDVRWRAGGAGVHPFVFAGQGDWILRNHMRSAGSFSLVLQFEGPGTVTWSGTNVPPRSSNWFDPVGNPLRINGGTLILKSSDLVSTDAGTVNIIHNGVLLKLDAQPTPGLITTPATIPGNISGTGPIQINAGTFTFTGASTFSGNINLTGGELIAGSLETVGVSGPLGQGGIISLTGGTLGFGPNNAFDYSPRFSAAGGQPYNIDTGGQNVAFAAGLSSSGGTLTKTGGGTLTLTGTSSYDGLTTISAGSLTFQGPKTGTSDIVVADGAGLGVSETDTQVIPNTLMLGSVSGCTLEFNNVTNTATAPLAVGTLSSGGTVTIKINSGSFTAIGQSFPLISWSGGSAPAVVLGTVIGANGTLSTNGNTIQFNVTSVPFVWTGAADGNWNLTSTNWLEAGNPTNYSNGVFVVFDDSATGPTSVTNVGVAQPGGVTITNNSKAYSFLSSIGNRFGGSGGLTKAGAGVLTLSGGANTYTGATTVRGGTLSFGVVANGGSASDIGQANNSAANLVLDGGTLQYTGGAAASDRLFTLGSGGGTFVAEGSGALALTNAGAIEAPNNGSRLLTLTGGNTADNTLAGALSDGPAGAVSMLKSGTGKWVLAGTNTFSGGTTIADGILQAGAGSSNGAVGIGNITNNSCLVFNRGGILTVPGIISGPGTVTNNGTGSIVLANNNTYTGGTTINAGALQIGNGGAAGSLDPGSPIVNNGTLSFNSTGNFSLNGIISGTGSLAKSGSGTFTLNAANTYSGSTTVSAGTLAINATNNTGSIVVNGGTLILNAPTHAASTISSGSLILNSDNYGASTIATSGTIGGTGTLYGPVTAFRLSPGASGNSIGTLTISNDLNFGGFALIDLNKAVSPSNDLIVVSGSLTNTGIGTLTVSNLGPALFVGDKFTLFSRPVQNGAALNVSGGGVTWLNNLAIDGSIVVAAVTRPTLNFVLANNSLQFSWSTSFGTYKLQAQTNTLGLGLSTNWADFPGGDSNPVTVPIDVSNETVFFRLVSP